jgi:hypothetical protein
VSTRARQPPTRARQPPTFRRGWQLASNAQALPRSAWARPLAREHGQNLLIYGKGASPWTGAFVGRREPHVHADLTGALVGRCEPHVHDK